MLDNTLFYSDKQKVTATAESTNVLDLGGGDVPHGLYLVAAVGTAFAGVTKMQIALETDDNSDFSAAQTLLLLPEYEGAALKENTVLAKVAMPLGLKKYSRVKYTVTGGGSAGDISVFLTDNPGIGQ